MIAAWCCSPGLTNNKRNKAADKDRVPVLAKWNGRCMSMPRTYERRDRLLFSMPFLAVLSRHRNPLQALELRAAGPYASVVTPRCDFAEFMTKVSSHHPPEIGHLLGDVE